MQTRIAKLIRKRHRKSISSHMLGSWDEERNIMLAEEEIKQWQIK